MSIIMGDTAEKKISCEIDSVAMKKRDGNVATCTSRAGMYISATPTSVAGAMISASEKPIALK